MLSWRPNTRFSSFPLNQLTAYVFWATAKDSPPTLTKKRGTKTTREGSRERQANFTNVIERVNRPADWGRLSNCNMGEKDKQSKGFSPKNKTSNFTQPVAIHQRTSSEYYLGRNRKRKWTYRVIFKTIIGRLHTYLSLTVKLPGRHTRTEKI